MLGFIINELGGWPILDNKYFNRNANSTLRTLIKLFKNGVSPLFNLYAWSSPFDPHRAVLSVRILFFDWDKFNIVFASLKSK